MNWTKDNSITLTRVCVLVVALALLLVDIFGYKIVLWYMSMRNMRDLADGYCFFGTLYALSLLAWLLLWALWKLLSNMQKGSVFTAENVKTLRNISWQCAAAAGVCLVSGLHYPPFLLFAAAAGFMMLIVRVVKNVFQQANQMKDELDLTI